MPWGDDAIVLQDEDWGKDAIPLPEKDDWGKDAIPLDDGKAETAKQPIGGLDIESVPEYEYPYGEGGGRVIQPDSNEEYRRKLAFALASRKLGEFGDDSVAQQRDIPLADKAANALVQLGSGAGGTLVKSAEFLSRAKERITPPSPFAQATARSFGQHETVSQAGLLRQAGQGLAEATEPVPGLRGDLVSTEIPATLGNLSAMITVGLVTGTGPFGAIITGYGAEAQEAFDAEMARQRRTGEPADPNKALLKANIYGAGATAVENAAGAGFILRQIGRRFGMKAAETLAGDIALRGRSALKDFGENRLREAVYGGLEEGSQGALQQLVVEGKIDDPDAIKKAILLGAIVEPIPGGVAQALTGPQAPQQPQAQPPATTPPAAPPSEIALDALKLDEDTAPPSSVVPIPEANKPAPPPSKEGQAVENLAAAVRELQRALTEGQIPAKKPTAQPATAPAQAIPEPTPQAVEIPTPEQAVAETTVAEAATVTLEPTPQPAIEPAKAAPTPQPAATREGAATESATGGEIPAPQAVQTVSMALTEVEPALGRHAEVIDRAEQQRRIKKAPKTGTIDAWFDTNTGKVVIVADAFLRQDGTVDRDKLGRKLVHEVAIHKGLREAIGKQKFGEVMDYVFRNLTETERKALLERDTTLAEKGEKAVAEESIAYGAEKQAGKLGGAAKALYDRAAKQAVVLFRLAMNKAGIKVSFTAPEIREFIREGMRGLEQPRRGAANVTRAQMLDRAAAMRREAAAIQANQIETAEEKIEDEVLNVAETEGKRSAEEIKQELVEKIKAAIDDTIDRAGVTLDKSAEPYTDPRTGEQETQLYAHGGNGSATGYIIKTKDGKLKLSVRTPEKLTRSIKTQAEGEWIVSALAAVAPGKAGKIKIHIPGDGDFTVARNGKTLFELLERAKAIKTGPEKQSIPKGPQAASTVGGIVDSAIGVYGTAEKARAAILSQVENEPLMKDLGYTEQQKAELYQAAELLLEKDPKYRAQKEVETLKGQLTDLAMVISAKTDAIEYNKQRNKKSIVKRLTDELEQLRERRMPELQARLKSANEKLAALSGESKMFSVSRAKPADGAPVFSAENATIVGPTLFSITAYHGTPHEVDKFSTSKIGTGEGAQVYGLGLYFAEEKAVAEQYAKNLAKEYRVDGKKITITSPLDPEAVAIDSIIKLGQKGAEAYAAEVARVGYASGNESHARYWSDVERYAISFRGKKVEGTSNTYTVRLNAEPDEFLDWDKPLSEQSEKIKESLSEYFEDVEEINKYDVLSEGKKVKAFFGIVGYNPKGYGIYEDIDKEPETASEKLKSLGIKGIRYLDQGSRGNQQLAGGWNVVNADGEILGYFRSRDAADRALDGIKEAQPTARLQELQAAKPTYNYVVFDDSIIEITAKNGEPVALQDAMQKHGQMFSVTPEKPSESRPHKGRLYTPTTKEEILEAGKAAIAGLSNEEAIDKLTKAVTDPDSAIDRKTLMVASAMVMDRVAQEAFKAKSVEAEADAKKKLALLVSLRGEESTQWGKEGVAMNMMADMVDYLAPWLAYVKIAQAKWRKTFGMSEKAVADEIEASTTKASGKVVEALKDIVAASVQGEIIEGPQPELKSQGKATEPKLPKAPDTVTGKARKKLLKLIESRSAIRKALREAFQGAGIDLRTFFLDNPRATQLERRKHLLKAIRESDQFKNLSREDAVLLEQALSTAWEAERMDAMQKQVTRLLRSAMPKPAAEEMAKRAEQLQPELIRAANAGNLDASAFRDWLAMKFNLPRIDGETAAKLFTLAQEVQSQPEGSLMRRQVMQRMVEALEADQDFSWSDFAKEWWYANVLLRIGTFANVAIGSGVTGFAMTATAAAERLGTMRPRQALRVLGQFVAGLETGALMMNDIIRKGDYSLLPDFERRVKSVLGGKVSRDQLEKWAREGRNPLGLWALTKRMMTGLDYLFAVGTYDAMQAYAVYTRKDPKQLEILNRKINRQATKQAEARAKLELGPDATMAQVRVRQREILEEGLDKEIKESAIYLARRAAQNADPRGALGWLYRKVNELPEPWQFPVKVVAGAAFLRAGFNAVDNATMFMPVLGAIRLARGSIQEGERLDRWGLRLEMSPEERRMTAAAQIIMTAAAYVLFKLADDDDDDYFEINGPHYGLTPQQRKQLAPRDKPLTIRIGDKAISYRNTPLVGMLAWVGSMRDAKRFKSDKWTEQDTEMRLVNGMIGGAYAMRDISSLSSLLGGVGSAYDDKDITGVNKWASQTIGRAAVGFTPSLLREIDEINDPKYYRPGKEAGIEMWMRHLPFIRRTVGAGPDLNMFGEPVEMEPPPFRRNYEQVQDDPVWRTVGRQMGKGIFIPMPSDQELNVVERNGNKRAMTEEEQYRYKAAHGRLARKLIEKKLGEFSKMDNAAAEKWFSGKDWDDVREQARREIGLPTYRRMRLSL